MGATDLTGIPDSGLLDMVRLILSIPGPLTSAQRKELYQINDEFKRRERLEYNKRRREQYRVRTMCKYIQRQRRRIDQWK